jgi:hypothetical protein
MGVFLLFGPQTSIGPATYLDMHKKEASKVNAALKLTIALNFFW